jgi:hypothetical protein
MSATFSLSAALVARAVPPYKRVGAIVRCGGVILAATTLTGTLAGARAPETAPALDEAQGISAATQNAARHAAAKARKHPRCDECGVIQNIRRVDAADGQAPTYEITIRLRDGSMRTSRNTTAGSWRAGDRLMLINPRKHASTPTT